MAAATHPYRQNLGTVTPVTLAFKEQGDTESGDTSQTSSELKKLIDEPDHPEDPRRILEGLPSPQGVRGPLLQHNKSASSPASSLTGTPSSSRSQLQGSGASPSLELRGDGHAKRRPKSLDLSHLFLLSDKDTQFTSTNESAADLSHKMITEYLGEAHNSTLVPRLKTIEMYKQNVKKSKDPNVLFQYAQYMLQTALTIDPLAGQDETTKKEEASQEEMRKQFLKEAQHYLKKLSVKGYSDAQYLLGDAYSSGAFGKVNNKDAFVLFQSAAKHGHVESAYRTAHCFEEGFGTTRDSRRAVEFLKFAASRNHPSAMFKLGLYSFYGRMGLPHDVNTKQNGIKWLSRAAARANELTNAAPYELAKIYQNGFLDIIIPDTKYAMELYIQAASLGHALSSTALGQIYEAGNEIVPADTSLSVHYYTQAAMQGEPSAMLGLCAWYLMGAEPAFKKDEEEAFQWALRAAKAGLPKAQFTIGYFYEKGKGCEPDAASARKWYERAAKNQDPRAISKLEGEGRVLRKQKSISTLNLFSNNSSSNLLQTDDRSRSGLSPNSSFSQTGRQPSEAYTSNASNTSTSRKVSANGRSDLGAGSETKNAAGPAGTLDLTDAVVTSTKKKGKSKKTTASSTLPTSQGDKKGQSKKKKDKKCVIM
ncbi:tetratricopeptide repeat protein [Lachancea thermotolerans CBS 6340]|uniref:KLTH0C06820p n=1 Tax=Lachancea thermotolerans (strain ATCC 56472 / CBS 6340 / NRRL Y-8284) TaxID=559295 RepID=C5DE72_LACTC|nr:KLTH0C06820p [Lachancea thermotolerans CBS 6340]CAR22083.1 KLTH0C06820p [Lachancea thermotolerans CBS 6340]